MIHTIRVLKVNGSPMIEIRVGLIQPKSFHSMSPITNPNQ